MKINNICLTVAIAAVSLFFIRCQDEVSSIGSGLTQNEMTIYSDTLAFNLKGKSVFAENRDSKSAYTLIGRLETDEYGLLECSYVTQFLPAAALNIPDTLTYNNVDSVKMIISVPRNMIIGDSLAPQQLNVYNLTKQLPADINSNFNPSGYYNPQPLGSKNYNLSGYKIVDNEYSAPNIVTIDVKLPTQIGRDAFKAYVEEPDIFKWPKEFVERWPGVFVKPTFGSGCIAPVINTQIFAYYPKTTISADLDEDGNNIYITKADSVCMFSTAPEVISSVNIKYEPSEKIMQMASMGDDSCVITTPGGYEVEFTFPAKEIIESYLTKEYDLGVINNLIFSIPAKEIDNKFQIGVPTSLLMVKSSEKEAFFNEGKVPDNLNSFVASYSITNHSYSFNSMREYLISLLDKGVDNIESNDVNFTLVPVAVSTEEITNPSTGEVMSYVTNVIPYMVKPTMVKLDMANPQIIFIYSTQTIN